MKKETPFEILKVEIRTVVRKKFLYEDRDKSLWLTFSKFRIIKNSRRGTKTMAFQWNIPGKNMMFY